MMSVDANLIEGFKLGVLASSIIALTGLVIAVAAACWWGRDKKSGEEIYHRDQEIRQRAPRI